LLTHASYAIARFQLHTNSHEIIFPNYRPQLKIWRTFFPSTGNTRNNTSHHGESHNVYHTRVLS